jgi:sugar lactone lactonase YvrE
MCIRTWPPRRATARGACLWLVLAAACGSSDKDSGPTKPADDSPHRVAEPSEGPAVNIALAANDPMSPAPFDATPSPDGKQVYYTAMGSDENGEPAPGVYSVAASGGQISRLAAGAPFVAPVNVSVSLDGKTLFVADPAASALFSLPSSGGTPSAVPGTEGYAPRGLTVTQDRNGREYVYFTGRVAESEQAGVFRISGAGGAVETVAAGEPFADPAGVAVDADGVAYVVETASEMATARVLRVSNGAPSSFAEGIGIGFPAGITVTMDGSTVLVSGLDPETKRDVVYFVDTTNKQISRLTKTVGQFHEPAGLHRAHNADVFAWADTQANGGSVFTLSMP